MNCRDMLIFKAIQNGYNPYCKSTDKGARRVSEDMRIKAAGVTLPARQTQSRKIMIRQMRAPAAVKSHRDVLAIENFEVVVRKSSKLSLGAVVSVLISAIVLAMIVFSGAQINEGMRTNAELSKRYEQIVSENRVLELELEAKNNVAVIEDIAKNDLGMIKMSTAEQKYVSLGAEDSVENYAEADEHISVGTTLLNTFSDILEYLD
ncbi:MAG: cell division protein FtsL [Clostridia bacterium]|nr:cell division protein FtsL [Clostridia bacterium]